jgi:hypothetical protein
VSKVSNESRLALEFERRLEPPGWGEGTSPGSLEAMAWRVRQDLTPPPPSAAFTAAARRRLLHRLPSRAARSQARPALGAVRRLAYALASVLLALTLGTAGVAYAAQEAIPGDSLYGVKRLLESARWSLTADPRSQAALLSDLAAERTREVEELAQIGRGALLAATLDDYGQVLDRLQAVAETLPQEARARVLAQVAARVHENQQVLERLLEQAPEQAAPSIEHAIERSSHGQQVLEALEQAESPSDLAPGQNKTKEPGRRRTPGPPETKGKP